MYCEPQSTGFSSTLSIFVIEYIRINNGFMIDSIMRSHRDCKCTSEAGCGIALLHNGISGDRRKKINVGFVMGRWNAYLSSLVCHNRRM